jgi:starch-binding outer membrane protein, SusD/RagB family
MKKTGFLLFIVATLFTQFGCKKFLDKKPLGQAITGDIPGGGVEGDIYGLYSYSREWGMTSLPFLTVHSARADDALNSTPGDGSDAQAIVDNFSYSKDHWLVNEVWNYHLAFIQKASSIIKDVETGFSTNPTALVNKAEASFFRAYAYFDMVRDYGPVPKIDFKVVQPTDVNVPRAPVSEIFALIDADLQFAIQYLPTTWDNPTLYVGRITKGAAYTLMAKSKLWRKDYAGALAAAETVINSNKYSLMPKYSDVFQEENENGSESIFAIQNYENATGTVAASNYVTQYQGVRGSGSDWDLGWGWNIPSALLVNNAYEPNDPRKGQTILFTGQRDDYLINDGGYGKTLPSSLPAQYWNKKVYTNPTRRASTGDRFGTWLDMQIYRYSDVLLMAAEAANEANNTPKALGYLELVRKRARNGNPAILPAVTSTNQAIVRTAIKKERRVEFAMEFERFYDLVRWTPASDGIDAPTVLGPLGYTPKNALMPIPQPNIDKSNGVLTQNPGY